MTKLNLKRVKDYKSLLSKDTRISISTENEMLRVSTVIGEMQNKDTPLTPEEEGGCGGGDEPPPAPPTSVDPSSSAPARGVRWSETHTKPRWGDRSINPNSQKQTGAEHNLSTNKQNVVGCIQTLSQSSEGWQADSRSMTSQIFLSIHYIRVRPRLRQRTPKTSSQNTSFPPAKISSLHPSYQLLSVWRGLS